MNERVDELAYQAGCNRTKYYDPKPPVIDAWLITQDELDKFAELIVNKFDDILLLEYLDCVGSNDKQSEQRIEQLREKVKTYFGVEE